MAQTQTQNPSNQQSMDDAPDFVQQAEAKAAQEQGQEKPEQERQIDIGMPDIPETPQEKSLAATKSLLRDRAYNHFLTQASDIVSVTSRIDNVDGRRLVFNALNRIEMMMADQGIEWKQVNQRKLIAALANTALLGLDAEQQEVYPIPYKEKGGYNITLQRGYKGERKLRLLHSFDHDENPIKWIDAYLVREGDTFMVEYGPETDKFEFKADPFSAGAVKGAFGYILYKSGRIKVHTLSLDDLEKRHKASKMPNSPAWRDWKNEMYLAKTIMAVCKDVVVHFEDKVLVSAYANTDIETAEVIEIEDANAQRIDPKALPNGTKLGREDV